VRHEHDRVARAILRRLAADPQKALDLRVVARQTEALALFLPALGGDGLRVGRERTARGRELGE
jgi:hypothetical protein